MVVVGLYARVSTKDKDQDPESQFVQMREYCQRKGWEYKEYSDKESGKLEAERSRKDLERMLSDLKMKVISGVIITDYRRFARSAELGLRLVRTIKSNGGFMDVVQENHHIETSSYSVSDMWRSLIGFGSGEADNIQHALDVRRGIDAKRKALLEQGGQWRWGRRPVVDAQEVRELRQRGLTIREIAAKLGVSTQPVMRALKEPVQKNSGIVRSGWV